MKKLILLSLLSFTLTGCMASKLAKAMEKSDATVSIDINTIYGRANFKRANPKPGQTVTLSPDGTMTVKNCE